MSKLYIYRPRIQQQYENTSNNTPYADHAGLTMQHLTVPSAVHPHPLPLHPSSPPARAQHDYTTKNCCAMQIARRRWCHCLRNRMRKNCCSSSSRTLSLSWPMSSLPKSYCDPAWPNRLLRQVCIRRLSKCIHGGRSFHSLAFLRDPLVPLLEFRRRGDVIGLFFHEGLGLVLELLHCDLRVRSCLLLHLDHLARLA